MNIFSTKKTARCHCNAIGLCISLCKTQALFTFKQTEKNKERRKRRRERKWNNICSWNDLSEYSHRNLVIENVCFSLHNPMKMINDPKFRRTHSYVILMHALTEEKVRYFPAFHRQTMWLTVQERSMVNAILFHRILPICIADIIGSNNLSVLF